MCTPHRSPISAQPYPKTLQLGDGPICVSKYGLHTMLYNKMISGVQRWILFCVCSLYLLLKPSSIYGKWDQFPIEYSDVKFLFKIKYKMGVDLKKKIKSMTAWVVWRQMSQWCYVNNWKPPYTNPLIWDMRTLPDACLRLQPRSGWSWVRAWVSNAQFRAVLTQYIFNSAPEGLQMWTRLGPEGDREI